MNKEPEDIGLSEDEIMNQLRAIDSNKKSHVISEPKIAEPENPNKKSIAVAIVGLPNAGKSSLMNKIIGEKIAGVSSKVQTTRNAIRGIKIFNDTQIVFIDSPGIINPRNVIDNFLYQATRKTMKEAEMIMVLMDIRSKDDDKFQIIIDNIEKYKSKKKILVINKIDLFSGEKLLELTTNIKSKFGDIFSDVFEISVLQGNQIDSVLSHIASQATHKGWLYPEDQISETTMKFCAAEITREKLFETMRMELPYSLLVDTDIYKEDDDLITIAQTIYVSRQNHKSMVIGKNASMIKNIGTQARTELEAITGKKVNLVLHVKCKEGWDSNEKFIKSIIGYTGS
jgi:GTP-binding protein Era